MTTQNYFVVENNVVTNVVVWDGDTNSWSPPEGAVMLPEKTTPTMIWMVPEGATSYVLTEVLGEGAIGFTWNGTVLTTNESQPADPSFT